jgi:hypothetical protein
MQVHSAVPFAVLAASMPAVVSACAAGMAGWVTADVGVVQLDVTSTDQTPAGFALPATTRIALSASGVSGVLAIATATGCGEVDLITGHSAVTAMVMIKDFLTPAVPGGDLSRIDNALELRASRIDPALPLLGALPALSVLSCAGGGAIQASRNLQNFNGPGSAVLFDTCRIAFG